MKKLYIIGARGCGREVFNFFHECKPTMGEIECAGFLDDNASALDGFEGYPPIISSVEDFQPKEYDRFICALGDPRWVKHYTSIIEAKGGRFISLISPYASIGKNTVIGEGSIIPGLTVISCDVTIGKHVYVGVFSDFGHDVKIGDCCHFGSYTFLGGGAVLGNCINVNPRVSVLPHLTIGDNAILGAGSVVIRKVAADTTVFGVPAKKIM